jgi:hypothetical protein
MDALWQLLVGLRLMLGRHPARVWLLWGLAAVPLVLTPLALADPAALMLLADPELAALFVLVGLAGLRTGALRVFSHPLHAIVWRTRG